VTAACSLVSGPHPAPELAAEAVRQALEKAGCERADSVLLFLTRDFARHAQPALLAAARVAGTMEIAGCTAYGLLTEHGWHLDQPAAAALVLAHEAPAAKGGAPLLSFSGHRILPYDWQAGAPRAGLLDAEAAAWAHSRLAADTCAEVSLPGWQARLACSSGLRLLGEPLTVDTASGYDLRRLGGHTAHESLLRCLPAELRSDPPLHQIALVRQPAAPAVTILTAAADGALTLAEPLAAGEQVRWAIRQPLASEQDMRQSLAAAVDPEKKPDFALMFSCLGRGPLFYGGDDRDLLAFRERCPGVPLIGAYGSGQIAPVGDGNRLFQNAVVTLLFESAHV